MDLLITIQLLLLLKLIKTNGFHILNNVGVKNKNITIKKPEKNKHKPKKNLNKNIHQTSIIPEVLTIGIKPIYRLWV